METNKFSQQPQQQSGLGIAGMILGIVAILFFCIGIGGLAGIIGLILSIIALNKKEFKRGCAIAGVVLNSIALLLFIFLMIIAISKTESSESSQQQTATTTAEPAPLTTALPKFEDNIIDINVDDCNIKYKQHELKKDYSGTECLVVYYEFTNNSDSTISFGYTFTDQAFQNGVALDVSYWTLENEDDNKYTEIKPGVTITVYSMFIPRDDSVVELEIDKLISFDNESEDSMTLAIK